MGTRFPSIASRWDREPSEDILEFRLVVPLDDQAARDFYATAGLAGAPSTPRTFPDLALAVVPLPRNDALLAALPRPPRTWMHSFRHECAHLLSVQYPQLRAAPTWFQEGFAELWCADDSGADGALMAPQERWPYWSTVHRWWRGHAADLPEPAEVRYSADAERVAVVLANHEGADPWNHVGPVPLPAYPQSGVPFHGLRGRHADWDPVSGKYLLATRPQEQVDLDLEHPWDGAEALTLELQLGRSPGQPEAGIVLFGTTDAEHHGVQHPPRIRLRHGLGGGFVAYAESGVTAGFQAFVLPNDRNHPGMTRVLELHRRGETLHVQCGDYRKAFVLSELGLQWPLRLRMVVRDGAFRLQTR
jgi:hypothetical protein